MKIKTKFCGAVDWEEQEIIHFSKGIPGFETEHRFVLLPLENSAFSTLQSVDTSQLAFVVIPPMVVCPDYSFDLDDQIGADLGVTKPEEVEVWAIVTVPAGNPQKTTVNLKAPIVIQTLNHQGTQVILNENYGIRTPLWKDALQK